MHSKVKTIRVVGSEVLTVMVIKSTICLPPAITLISGSAYLSTLKMEEICSSETSVDFQQTIRRYIPEEDTLLIPLCFLNNHLNKCVPGGFFPGIKRPGLESDHYLQLLPR
jgi:hypothetical protein